MRWIDMGWASFIEDATEFSEAFRMQMAEQLMQQFNALLGKEDGAAKRQFSLFVGMEPMEIHYKDGWYHITVEIIGPDSSSRHLSAHWQSDVFDHSVDLTQSNEVNVNNIRFAFGSDFDKDAFLRYFSMPKLSKKKYELTFDVEYDFALYPDLSLEFHFREEVSADTFSQIRAILVRNIPGAYISELSPDSNGYTAIVDFQAITFKIGKEQLIKALGEMSAAGFGKSIRLIRIQ
jgi:hypothetical protein